jgi:two-component system, chemotaxis family, protein-glutamate methylesterase/glutaminase
VVVVAASAGGIDAVRTLLGALPEDFPAPVIVLLHLLPEHPSMLQEVLARATALPVEWVSAGARLAGGHVYVAPPAVHSILGADGELELDDGPPVHFVRPSADRLLASCADAYRADTVAVILTGTGVDGADGASAVRAAGGTVIAQDRETSRHFGMPGAAIAAGAVDTVLPLGQIPAELVRLSAVA